MERGFSECTARTLSTRPKNGIDNSRMKLTECAVPGVVGNCLDACPCLVQRFARVMA